MNKNRKIALLLTIIMLISTLTACKPTTEETSSIVSEMVSETTSDVPEIVYNKDTIDALYTSTVDRTLKKNDVLAGKSYSVSYAADSDYPDTANLLTDNTYAESYFGSSEKKFWAGFYARIGGDLTIEIDLGAIYTDIADIGISFCNNASMGIQLPDEVEFYISNGGEYAYIGSSITPTKFDSADLYRAVLNLQGGISASKIKIVCLNPRSTWMFIDEVYAIKYQGENTGESTSDNYYGTVNIPIITEPTYWSESDEDYNTTKNLLSGLSQQINTLSVIDGDYANESKNSPSTSTKLTDGRVATNATYSASEWFHITRGIGREIYYDLGNTSAVTGYSFGFLKEEGTGVKLPESVTVFASENGVDWQTIKSITSVTSSKESDIVRLTGKFNTSYRARYIKVYIPVNSHVYVDEIEITGTMNVGAAKAIVPDEGTETAFPNEYASPENFNGTEDILLSYICHPSVQPITKEVYLPHVAYIEDGTIKDTLFDSFMFLPYVAFLYEGQSLKSLTKADWQTYIDTQFTEGKNMDALNEAVGETKTALGLSDYQASVFLSILEPASTQTAFGEVNGKNLDFTKLADRKAAVKWLIDEQIKGFESKGYENLNIQGFYWFVESIDYSDAQIVELIDYATDYVRSLGYITSWIPYYQASGYNNWKKLGFDLTCYQPNFAFNFEVPDQRLYDAAASAKLLGMCIELEIGGSSAADADRLKKYYAAGAKTGFMTDAIHMYYQGGVPGSIYNAYTSTNPYFHSLYEDTYKFMKGTYNPTITPAESTFLSCSASTPASGTVTVSSENAIKSYLISVSPKYGTIQLNVDGSYVYTPFHGITGEDYFEITVDYGYGTSEPAKITITIS